MFKLSNVVLLSLLAGGALVACNNMGSSNGSGVQFLPQGTYSVKANFTSGICHPESMTATSNGSGQFCLVGTFGANDQCSTLNLSNNPCFTLSQNVESSTTTLSFGSCVFNSATNVATAVLHVTATTTPPVKCAGTVTLTKTN